MMKMLIEIALSIAAIYSGGMYLAHFLGWATNYAAFKTNQDAARQLELNTFHLGLCFILSVGFIGLLIK